MWIHEHCPLFDLPRRERDGVKEGKVRVTVDSFADGSVFQAGTTRLTERHRVWAPPCCNDKCNTMLVSFPNQLAPDTCQLGNPTTQCHLATRSPCHPATCLVPVVPPYCHLAVPCCTLKYNAKDTPGSLRIDLKSLNLFWSYFGQLENYNPKLIGMLSIFYGPNQGREIVR